MYLLYLDGSGDPGWPPPYGTSAHNYFILAGLCIKDTDWHRYNSRARSLLTEYFGKSIPKDKELHRSLLIAGNAPFHNLREEDRKKMDNDVFNLILELKPTLFASVVDKMAHKQEWGERAMRPDSMALRHIASGFNIFLQRRKEMGIIIMDECEARKDGDLKELICDAHENGIVLKSQRKVTPPPQNNLENIVEAVMFTPSKDCHLVQLSDFCANALFAKYVRNNPWRCDQIHDLFDHFGDRYFGLVELPKK